ncbi:hypothetical protein DYH55_09665 [Methylovirgula sp. 4M-Z18]|nr:hypothetical protein DYH55_09665 [Methylovirgula sp. 4M-Z18]
MNVVKCVTAYVASWSSQIMASRPKMCVQAYGGAGLFGCAHANGLADLESTISDRVQQAPNASLN